MSGKNIDNWAATCQNQQNDLRPAKTQISLSIRPVWSESSLCAQWVAKDQNFLHADSEDSDQTSGHGVAGSNPAGGEILSEPKRRFIAQSFSCSSFHRLEVTEILLKGRKTLTHPSIWSDWADAQADLSLRWACTPFCWVCHVAAQLCKR